MKFQPSVVRTACKLLNTPDKLTLDEIEELNLKCQSTLQSEYSSESGSGSDVEDAIHFKSQLIAPKVKGKGKKLAGPVGETSTKKCSTSQSSFTLVKHLLLHNLPLHTFSNSKGILTPSTNLLAMHLH